MSEQSSSDGMTKRFVRAAVVSAATGAITYGIRKAAPAVAQKLQSLGDGGVPGKEALGKAKDAVEEKVEDLGVASGCGRRDRRASLIDDDDGALGGGSVIGR